MKVLIIGATIAGLGLAYELKEKCIVIERTNHVGHEYIDAYNSGKEWNSTVLTEKGEGLKKELLDRNILSEEGKVLLPAVMPVLFNRINTEKINIMLLTEILDIQKKGTKFKVMLMSASGKQTIMVQKIIDTTAEGIFIHKQTEKIQSKSINAVLHCEKPGRRNRLIFEEDKVPSAVLEKGLFPSEAILKIQVENNDDWITSRHKLHQWWLKKPRILKGWTLAAVATSFEICVPKGPLQIEAQWIWLPSAAYINLLEAFEAGLVIGGGVVNDL